MKPAYSLLKSLHQQNLSHLFARCTFTSVEEIINFSPSFWQCHQEDACVAFHHDEQLCGLCGDNEHAINSMSYITSMVDVQTQMRSFDSMKNLNGIIIQVLCNCADVRNLVPGSVDKEYCLSVNGFAQQGTLLTTVTA